MDVKAKRLGEQVRPDFRPTPDTRSACYFAELEFVVDSLGLPETGTARVIRTNNPEFATAALATLPQWKYEPARIGTAHVRQITMEKRGLTMATVSVPAGSGRPTAPPRGSVPRC